MRKKNAPQRKNPRIKNYDYSTPGYYFVTICTHNKECIFGGPEILNRYGNIAQIGFEQIPVHFEKVEVIKSVVMPNHVHAIIALNGECANLSTVIGSYKAHVTRQIRKINPKAIVWQASFHDHVIRDQCGYQKIRLYIEANPARWEEDCFYMDRQCDALPGGGHAPALRGRNMSISTCRTGTLEYLVAQGIAVPHCFTTRLGGVSTRHLASMNIAFHRGDSAENVVANYRILADALGFSAENLVLTHQIHSDVVRTVTRADAAGLDHHAYPECDALITNDPGTALVVFTADCTPILLWDPVTGAVGAAHAGWRGTAADIAGKTVRAMQAEFGCDPADIHAAIGPNIGQCCFQTDAEVPQAMIEALGDAALPHIREVGSKYYVNLKEINAQFLKNAGVKHIEISKDCTMCQHDRFWSHRYTRGERGSQGAIIVCKEVQP